VLVQLGAQAGGHLGRRGARQAQRHLDRVVDEPLEGGERADHDDARGEAAPHALPAQLARHLQRRRAALLVQLAHHRVRRVRHHRAEHARLTHTRTQGTTTKQLDKINFSWHHDIAQIFINKGLFYYLLGNNDHHILLFRPIGTRNVEWY